MKYFLFIIAMSSMASSALCREGFSDNASILSTLTETNRKTVEKFVDLFYRKKLVREAFETYVVEDYIQHNPDIPDGRNAAILALEPMFSKPNFMIEVKRILVDGDTAVVHLHAKSSPEERGGSVMDMFRLENGKIVEHWDVLQEIPEKAANPHPMF